MFRSGFKFNISRHPFILTGKSYACPNRKNKRSYMKHHKVFSICNIREHNKVNCIQLEMWETNVRGKNIVVGKCTTHVQLGHVHHDSDGGGEDEGEGQGGPDAGGVHGLCSTKTVCRKIQRPKLGWGSLLLRGWWGCTKY